MRTSLGFRALLHTAFFSIACGGCSNSESPPAQPPDRQSGSPTASQSSKDAGAQAEQPAEQKLVEKQPKIVRIDPGSLPVTKGYSPAVDGGRLQIPLIPDWVIPPRNPEWLFRLQRDKNSAYPQIFVTLDDALPPELQELVKDGLTKDNVHEFANQWRKHLEKSHDPQSFAEPVAPLRIGDRYAVSYLIYASSDKYSQDRLMATVVEQGRVYTCELRTLRGTLEDYRSELYAVVAVLKANVPADGPGGLPTFGETPAEEPSEAPPRP